MRTRPALLFLLALLALPHASAASDHADPIRLTKLEAGITGLFTFPKGDDLVVVLTIRRGLTAPKPYDLEPYEYAIHMDLDSAVDYDKPADVARYGGTVRRPEGIREKVAIRFRLTEHGTLQRGYPQFEGLLGNTGKFPVYVGVRDDPFIFPRFFGKNVIAMAVSIPFSAFPAGQQDWLIWGSSKKKGLFGKWKKIDHVGRSNRTQLGRFDFLNPLHPSEHAARIERSHDRGHKVQAGMTHLMGHFLPVGAVSGLFQYVLQVRPYDLHPDVVIFTTRSAPGFPNGRRLEDDVAGLTCAHGDCVLQEVAFIEGDWPRATVNDKPFLDEFPYLAEPHRQRPQEDDIDRCALIFWLIVLVLFILWVLYKRWRAKKNETPWVRRR